MNSIIKENLNAISSYFSNQELKFIEEIILLAQVDKLKLEHWYTFDEKLKVIALNKSGENDEVKEFHNTYTDYHITIRGCDTLFIGDSSFKEIENHLELRDYCLVYSKTIQQIRINSDEFLKVEKGVIHCNVLADKSIKLVVKKEE